MQVVFDTDILIDHLRGIESAKKLIEKTRAGEIKAYVSAITEAELLAGKECEKEEKRANILELIKLFTKIDVNNPVAQKSGEFRRLYNIPIQDCIIAATCFNLKCKLWTRNKKDFNKIREIVVESPY